MEIIATLVALGILVTLVAGVDAWREEQRTRREHRRIDEAVWQTVSEIDRITAAATRQMIDEALRRRGQGG